MDWNYKKVRDYQENSAVLPLTREWIEISPVCLGARSARVLPLTREWIEIYYKSKFFQKKHRSPSYEGVDWNLLIFFNALYYLCSPSYEGVDWNGRAGWKAFAGCGSPSYEGVDWNCTKLLLVFVHIYVLPLTREWIEMISRRKSTLRLARFSLLRGSGLKFVPSVRFNKKGVGSPSYEGVDWNNAAKVDSRSRNSSPSYEGVDWNKNN